MSLTLRWRFMSAHKIPKALSNTMVHNQLTEKYISVKCPSKYQPLTLVICSLDILEIQIPGYSCAPTAPTASMSTRRTRRSPDAHPAVRVSPCEIGPS
jgi:hypothetical protein